jgi:hypothetical protein
MTTTPAVTSLEQLRRQQAPEASMPVVKMGFDSLQGFELMQRAAKAFAASTLVPQQYQGNLPNCIIALEMASRMGASPLMVAQNLYIVHGRPGWSSQFLIASFNQCGRFSAIRYEWSGDKGKDSWGCKAWAVELSTKDKIEGPTVTMRQAKDEGWYDKKGSKWQTLPELMLMYRAAGFMVRTHAPEIAMGLQTSEEIHDVYDAEPESYSVTTEQLRGAAETVAEQAPAAPATTTDRPSPWDQLVAVIDKAEAAQDTETAYLLLDEARSMIAEIPSDRLLEAKVLVDAVSEKLSARA